MDKSTGVVCMQEVKAESQFNSAEAYSDSNHNGINVKTESDDEETILSSDEEDNISISSGESEAVISSGEEWCDGEDDLDNSRLSNEEANDRIRELLDNYFADHPQATNEEIVNYLDHLEEQHKGVQGSSPTDSGNDGEVKR